jgi:hypothetical protein
LDFVFSVIRKRFIVVLVNVCKNRLLTVCAENKMIFPTFCKILFFFSLSVASADRIAELVLGP